MTDKQILEHRQPWATRWLEQKTGWNLGQAHPYLAELLERAVLEGGLAPAGRIYVPGCGHGHEAAALAQLGYQTVAVDFVEQALHCCDIIKQNLEKTKLEDYAHVNCCSVNKAISFLDKEYGIVLMDPPYSSPLIGKTIEQLANSKLVGDKSIVVVTHSQRKPLQSSYASLNLVKEYRHGDSVIALYKKEASF